MTRISGLAACVAIGLLVGCSSTPPTTSPSDSTPTVDTRATPAATLTPTAAAIETTAPTETPGPPVLGDHWDPIRPSGRASIKAGVSGEAGFVLVGGKCAPSGDCSRGPAAAWFFDGSTWQPAEVENADDVTMTEVTFGGHYVAAGMRLKGRMNGVLYPSLVLWRSDDGRAWTRLGSFDLDECDMENGCPALDDLAITDSGIVLAYVVGLFDNAEGAALFRTSDGKRWTRIDPHRFRKGGNDDGIAGIDAVGEEVLVTWARGESADVWSGRSDRDWQQIGTLGARIISFAPGLGQLFAAGSNCRSDCQTRLWERSPGGGFQRVHGPDAGLLEVGLAFAGNGGLVLVGDNADGLSAFQSFDGTTWIARSPDIAAWGDCVVDALAGGPGAAVLIDDCGNAWITQGA